MARSCSLCWQFRFVLHTRGLGYRPGLGRSRHAWAVVRAAGICPPVTISGVIVGNPDRAGSDRASLRDRAHVVRFAGIARVVSLSTSRSQEHQDAGRSPTQPRFDDRSSSSAGLGGVSGYRSRTSR